MKAGDQQREEPRKIYTLLAGIQAGILGGMAMLAWLGLASVWNSRSIWSIPNLLATTFYGEAVFRRGFRWPTMSGIAFHFFLVAVIGIIFGFIATRIAGRSRVMLLGLFFGLAWYYLSFGLLWNWVNPLVPLYGTGTSMVFAHILLGTFLGRAPRYQLALEDAPVQNLVEEPLLALPDGQVETPAAADHNPVESHPAD